ncbi:hypothetical protein ACWPKO_09050 [Coraliomargarita sp. W4R53]
MMHLFKILVFVLPFAASSLNAQMWVTGAVTLHEMSGEVSLQQLGARDDSLGPGELPVSIAGLINCQASYGSSAYFSTSNRTHLYFEGKGSFAIERFEQLMPDLKAWEADEREAGQSRMILNFRAGDLIVDNRNMLDSSQCLVETPLGRLTVKGALWQMQIVFDARSQIFDFTITCSEGRVRFTDLQGQHYTLRAGQRLAGAGSRITPSIEVGENTDRSLEQMQRYQTLSDEHFAAGDRLAPYLEHIQSIDQAARQAVFVPAQRANESMRRPIVIEYADEPSPVTPFRGQLKSPSGPQADLF